MNEFKKNLPQLKPYFTGRHEELENLSKAFQTESIISIEGDDGIGKTQFVSKFISEIKDSHQVVWFTCTSISQPDDFLNRSGFGELLKGEMKPSRTKFSAFKEKMAKNKMLLILDDYHFVKGNESFEIFTFFMNNYLKEGKIIFIGKKNILNPIYKIKNIRLSKMEEGGISFAQNLIKYFYSSKNISSTDLELICNKLNGFPLAIEFAVYLLSQDYPSDKIFNLAFHGAGTEEVSNEKASKNLLKEIFAKTISEEEQEALKVISVFNKSVEEEAIKFVWDKDGFEEIKENLIQKNLLSYENNRFSVHSLVRIICQEKLEESDSVHIKAAKYFESLRNDFLNPELEEQIFHHHSSGNNWSEITKTVISKGRDFISAGHLDQLSLMINSLKKEGIEESIFDLFEGDLAFKKGDWEKVAPAFQKAKESNEELVKAEGMTKFGEIQYRMGDAKSAEIIFKEILDNSSFVDFKKIQSRAINNLGIIQSKLGNKKKALEFFEKSLVLREEQNDKKNIVITLNNIAMVKSELGENQEAIEIYERSKKISEGIGNRKEVAIALSNLGRIQFSLGNKKEGAELNKSSLELREEIGDRKGLADCFFNNGIVAYDLGNHDEAIELYERGLEIREELEDKPGVASSLFYIGEHYFKSKKLNKACSYLLKSYAIYKQLNLPSQNNIKSWLDGIRNQNKEVFKIYIEKAYSQLDTDLKEAVDLNEILGRPKIAAPKIGRNDPCHCGSGKKYKKCHGR